MRVRLLGSPFLAGSASRSDSYFASIVFTNPNHAVCRKREIMFPWEVQAWYGINVSACSNTVVFSLPNAMTLSLIQFLKLW